MYLIRYDKIKKRKLYEVQVPSYAESSHEGMLWIEMVGAEQACRAIWAFIVKHRTERSVTHLNTCVMVDGLNSGVIKVNPITKYHMIPTKHGLVMFHEKFNKMNGEFMLGGDEEIPSRWFKTSLQRLVSVPFLPEWTDDLWREGVKKGLVYKPSTCVGAQVWILKTYAGKWEDTMGEMLREGTISG